MRLHSDTIELNDIALASVLARVTVVNAWDIQRGSRSRVKAFEVKLLGESNRRPNGGTYGAGNDYAATWDQWGVFLGILYRLDPNMKCWAYANAEDFNHKTNGRFQESGFPADYHGDHTFRYAGEPYTQACTKCSAVQRWAPREELVK